jgi:hypothetical protein
MGFIYQIRNTVNGKCYVGQTRRRLVSHRWSQHKRRPDGILKFAFASHGLDKFEFSVICEIPNEELNDREVKEISERRTLAPNGYNLQTGGNVYSLCDEMKERIRQSKTGEKNARFGVKLTDEVKERIRQGHVKDMKSVDQYTLDGTFMKTWESLKSTQVTGVSRCCTGELNKVGGFVWRWHGKPFDRVIPTDEAETLKQKRLELYEKNRERINAWKRANRLKLCRDGDEGGG